MTRSVRRTKTILAFEHLEYVSIGMKSFLPLLSLDLVFIVDPVGSCDSWVQFLEIKLIDVKPSLFYLNLGSK